MRASKMCNNFEANNSPQDTNQRRIVILHLEKWGRLVSFLFDSKTKVVHFMNISSGWLENHAVR